MNQTTYAKHRGVSQRYIARLIRMQLIPRRALKKVGKRVQVHRDLADESLANSITPSTKQKSPTFDKVRTEALLIRNRLALHKIEKMESELVRSSEVQQVAAEVAERVRGKLLALPALFASEIAEETSPEKVRDLLQKTFRHALLELLNEDFL